MNNSEDDEDEFEDEDSFSLEKRDLWLPDKTRLVESRGRPIVQSLFLENGYNEMAYYTHKEYDYEYKGVLYKSLGKLYVQEMDPVGHSFAQKYLLGWDHWCKIRDNAQNREVVQRWEDELEVKIRSQALQEILMASRSEKGSFPAAQFLVKGGWVAKKMGRPKADEVLRKKAVDHQLRSGYDDMIKLDEANQ